MQVAACELLHSLVVYMVGKSAQMVEGETSLPPMYKLHKRLFPVLLRLACDVDQVRADLLSDFFFDFCKDSDLQRSVRLQSNRPILFFKEPLSKVFVLLRTQSFSQLMQFQFSLV